MGDYSGDYSDDYSSEDEKPKKKKKESPKVCAPIDLLGNQKKKGIFDAVIGVRDKWPNGSALKVYFYPEVNKKLQDRTLKKMMEWSYYCNITFVNHPDIATSDLRVTFRKGGSWAYLGTQANLLKNEPTMNFGWLNEKSPDEEFNRVVLHETGHALGLQHEHQHPTNTIPWNHDAVIEYYKRQGWTAEQTEVQVLARTPKAQTQFSAYDKNSIMEYPIPKELVTDPSYETGWNTALTPTDIEFIGKQYPFPAGHVPTVPPPAAAKKGKKGSKKGSKKGKGKGSKRKESAASSVSESDSGDGSGDSGYSGDSGEGSGDSGDSAEDSDEDSEDEPPRKKKRAGSKKGGKKRRSSKKRSSKKGRKGKKGGKRRRSRKSGSF